jgi:hypothetical protein
LTVDPGVGEGVDDFLVRRAQHLRDHGGGRNLHQHDVIETHAIEAVFERDDALDLVRPDHALQHVAHRQRRVPVGDVTAREVIGHSQDPAQIVRRMAPLGGEPGVVEVEPANHAADVERRHDRIELEGGSGHARPVRHYRAGHDRTHELGASRVGECFQPAAQGIHQAIACGFEGFLARDLIARDIVRDVGEDLVRFRANIGDGAGHGGLPIKRLCSCHCREVGNPSALRKALDSRIARERPGRDAPV